MDNDKAVSDVNKIIFFLVTINSLHAIDKMDFSNLDALDIALIVSASCMWLTWLYSLWYGWKDNKNVRNSI